MSDDELVSTPSQTVGPFFHFGLTTPFGRQPGAQPKTETLTLVIRVFDGDGVPMDDAVVEFWHRESEVGDARAGEPASHCGRAATGPDGGCEIVIAPPQAGAGTAAHLNLCVFARGLLRQVYTRVYFAGDPALDSDPVLALVPTDRRATLIAQPDATQHRRWSFDLHLQGPLGTVFFDR